MSANSWSVVMMAMVRFLVSKGIETVDNATLQALAGKPQFVGLCYNPDAIKANVGAGYYDETPFGTFPTLFQSAGNGWKPLPENEWVFRTTGRGKRGGVQPNAKILALLDEPKPETPVAPTTPVETETESQE